MKKLSLLLSLTATNCHANVSHEHAMEYQKSGNFAQAIESYKNLLEQNRYDLSALFNLGTCYLSTGKMEEAIATFNMILSVNPHIISVLYNKAYTYKTAGNLDMAIPLYKKIISIDKEYDPAHLALGFAYLINGDFENGWKQHERYLKKSGKNGDRLRSLLETNNVAGKIIL